MEFLPKCCFGGSASASTKQPSSTVEDLSHRFSLSQLRKATNNFDPTLKIGKAAFDFHVYRGRISINGEPKEVSVKRLTGEDGISAFKNEVILMCQLHHPNLMSLVGFCDDKSEMIVVHESVSNGSLYDHLYRRDSNSPILSWKKRLEISIGLARGLHYLHSGTKRTIIYRQVKPSNIFLDENWVPKLVDFQLSLTGTKYSRKSAKPISLDDGISGGMGFCAPECINCTNVTHKCDVYSFGVVLFELICRNSPAREIFKIIDQEREDKGLDDSACPPFLWHDVAKKLAGSMDLESEDQEISENEHEDEHAWRFIMNIDEQERKFVERGNVEENIDPNLAGEIAAECLKLYVDITKSCMREDPNERPDMGEVEVQLEYALELQEEADANHGFHALL